jgi:hypothetical protein
MRSEELRGVSVEIDWSCGITTAFDNPVWPTLILTFGPLPWFSFCSYSH